MNRLRLVVLLAVAASSMTSGGLQAAPEPKHRVPPAAARSFYLDLDPAASAEKQDAAVDRDQPRRRIVSGRPKLYLFKRVINPINWIAEPLESVFLSAERGRIRGLVEGIGGPPKRAGFQFFISGAGSGSRLGPGVRIFHKNLLGRGIEVDVPLLITYTNYQVFEFNTRFPILSDHRLDFDARGSYRSRPRDNFFGIGNDSPSSEKTKFRGVEREVLAGFSSAVDEDWRAGLHLAYRHIGVTDPEGVPSAQDFFDPAAVPGLREGAELLSAILTLEQDGRDNRRIPSSGGLRRLELSLNEGMGRGDFSFWKYRLDVQQFFPLDGSRRKIIALRGMLETNQEKGGSQIPFFEMASLGGANTMRSLQNFRYYDKSALAFLMEYRYRIWRAFDWVLFLEEGQVAPEPGDFGWGRFHTGYGFRFYIRATPTFPVSFDIARGRDGWRVYFRFKPSF